MTDTGCQVVLLKRQQPGTRDQQECRQPKPPPALSRTHERSLPGRAKEADDNTTDKTADMRRHIDAAIQALAYSE